jgi:hypothetical protein
MLIASTTALALLRETTIEQTKIPSMFFEIINGYDSAQIPGITSAQWYKNKTIVIKDNGVSM